VKFKERERERRREKKQTKRIFNMKELNHDNNFGMLKVNNVVCSSHHKAFNSFFNMNSQEKGS